MIEIYTDGCRKKSGTGGYAAIMLTDKPLLFGGYRETTTNNVMELAGPFMALRYSVKAGIKSVRIPSDSDYFVQGFNSWMHNWHRRNWKRSRFGNGKGEVKNLDIWKGLFLLKKKIKKATAFWVRGHNGHLHNELCDSFANVMNRDKVTQFEMEFDSFEDLKQYILQRYEQLEEQHLNV